MSLNRNLGAGIAGYLRMPPQFRLNTETLHPVNIVFNSFRKNGDWQNWRVAVRPASQGSITPPSPKLGLVLRSGVIGNLSCLISGQAAEYKNQY